MKTKNEKLKKFLDKNYILIYGRVITKDEKTGLIGIKKIDAWFLKIMEFKFTLLKENNTLKIYDSNTGIHICCIQMDKWNAKKINEIVLEHFKKIENDLKRFESIKRTKSNDEAYKDLLDLMGNDDVTNKLMKME